MAIAICVPAVAAAKDKPRVKDAWDGFWTCKSEQDSDIAAQGCDGSGTVCWCCYANGCYYCDLNASVNTPGSGCWSMRRLPRIGDVIRTPLGSVTISPDSSRLKPKLGPMVPVTPIKPLLPNR
jgi:hypothetical protein